MMIEHATVIAYQQGVATVQCHAKSGCGGCSAKASCGVKSLSGLAGEKFAPQLEVAVSQPLKMGDTIEIGLQERSLLYSVMWLYCVPLMVIIFSTLLFSSIFQHELAVAGAVFGCTGFAFIAIKKIIAQQNQGEFIPVFVRKL